MNQDPQHFSVQGFTGKMQKLLDGFINQCGQFDSMILNEVQEAEFKISSLTLELQQKSLKQMNAVQRSQMNDLTAKIERKKDKIAELRPFLSQIQQFQNDQVQSLQKYFVEAHKSHPLVKIDSQQQQAVGNQQNNNSALVQQLYLQIQDLQIKVKNLELDVQMKGVYQQQLNELTERNTKLELVNKQMQKDYETLNQEHESLQMQIFTLELQNRTFSAELEKVNKAQQKFCEQDGANFKNLKRNPFIPEQSQISLSLSKKIKKSCKDCGYDFLQSSCEINADDLNFCLQCSQQHKPQCKKCYKPLADPNKDCTYCKSIIMCVLCNQNPEDLNRQFCIACYQFTDSFGADNQQINIKKANLQAIQVIPKQCQKCHYKGKTKLIKNQAGKWVCPYGCRF